jgi:hypothetical protein
MTRTLSALAATTTALLLLIPAAAHANTYDVYSCWAGYGTFHNPNASSAAWTRDQASSGGHFGNHEDCGVNPTDGAMLILSQGTTAAKVGEFARLKLDAPIGLSVGLVQVWRNAWSYGTGSGSISQRNQLTMLTSGNALLGGTDADGAADVPFGTRGTTDTTAHGILPSNLTSVDANGATSVEYRVGCSATAGCPTSWPSAPTPNHAAAGVEIYGTQVTVQDSNAPTVVVSDGGLFSGAGGSGVSSVTVSAASDPSGIKRLAVYADFSNSPLGVIDYEQNVNLCNWTVAAPCQNVTEVEIPVDTTLLPNGDHSFVVKAFDAADNEKTSSTHYATIYNQPDPVVDPPSDPTDPPADDPGTNPGPAPGGGGSGAPSDVGLPNGTVDGGNGGSVQATGQPKLSVSFDGNGKARYAARYNRMVAVRGVLVDGTGARIANAQVDYSAQSTTPRARVQNLGSVRTDSSGTFNLTIATKLGSRKLRFGYSPQIGGAPAANAEAQLDVIPPVSLKVSPKHLRNGKSVTFRGRMGAGPIPHKGKLVNLQVRLYGHWHTFATVRTSKSGRFKYRYRFRRTYGYVVYRFRARSRYEAAYPFVAGSSHTVRVAVTSCPVGCD